MNECTWPYCLNEADAELLDQEIQAELIGYPITVTVGYDKSDECGCKPGTDSLVLA